MAIARTGYSASAINGGTGNTGSFDITVPAGTDCLIVYVTGYESIADLFTGSGAGATLEGATADAVVTGSDISNDYFKGAAWVFLNPPVGAGVTIAWDWAGTGDISNPAHFTWVAYSGVGSIRQAYGNQASGPPYSTGVLTSSSGDMISVSVFGYTAGEASVSTWSNAVEISEFAATSTSDSTLAEHESTGNVTIATPGTSGYNDGGIMAVIMVPAAGAANTDRTPTIGSAALAGIAPRNDRGIFVPTEVEV